MAFVLESETYDSFIDSNVREGMKPILEGEEDDDEETPEAALAAFDGFIKKAGDGNAKHLLRSFVSVRFAKDVLARVTGKGDKVEQIGGAIVKALLLHEMLLRQMPVDTPKTVTKKSPPAEGLDC